MKTTYSAILFLFVCQFGIGQVPGTPFFLKGDPSVYTYAVNSPTPVSAVVTGEIITRGQTIEQSGIIWGTSPTLTIASATGSITTVTKTSGAKSATITGLVAGTIYYIAYYTLRPGTGTIIGNTISYEHGTVTTLTGRKWLQWNLGATAVPETINTPSTSLGSLYQWGRGTDGHEIRSSARTVLTSSNIPKLYNQASIETGTLKNQFLINSTTNSSLYTYSNWLEPNFDPLWQGVNGINNPCPSGYRLPTANEFQTEGDRYMFNATQAFAGALKLQNTGMRLGSNGSISSNGYYWTSTVDPFNGDYAYYFRIIDGFAVNNTDGRRINGMYVRCIQDIGNFSSSGGTAKVQSYDCPISGANGQMLVGVDLTNTLNPISQTITANVIEEGTYVIHAAYENTGFAASGTFAGTGSQTITLNAREAIPLEAIVGTNKYYLSNSNPYCEFERKVFYPESYGTAKITSFNATTAVSYPGGVMTDGVPVSGVYQNVTATLPLETAGTYSLTTDTVRGVTFSGSGTFPAGGANRQATFQLIASGIPTGVIDSANNLYTLNPISNDIFNLDGKRYTFGRHIYLTGTGTGIFSTLTTPASYTGTAMPVGTTIITGTGRTHRVTANVSTIGTYNISATNNGVTFHRAGSFTNTGTTNNGILLVPTGTPIASGTFSFTTNTNPSATFSVTF
jgi:hypothetical protein